MRRRPSAKSHPGGTVLSATVVMKPNTRPRTSLGVVLCTIEVKYTTVDNSSPPGVTTMSYDGLLRDRVGAGNLALGEDGKMDAVFMVEAPARGYIGHGEET